MKNENNVNVCKWCERAIIFATNEEGRKVALTLTQEVYAIVYPSPNKGWLTKRAKQEVYVNHILICKEYENANHSNRPGKARSKRRDR